MVGEFDKRYIGAGEGLLLWIFLMFALTGVFYYRAQLRDIQRRIAIMEQRATITSKEQQNDGRE